MFAAIPNRRRIRSERICKKEVGRNESTILTYAGNTDAWGEPNANLEGKKNEVIKKIDLRLGLGELRGKSNAWEKTNSGKQSKQLTDKKR